MAPPPPSSTLTTSRVITLVLKVAVFILLFISLIVLLTATVTIEADILSGLLPDSDQLTETVHFDDFYAYRYVLASIVFGLVYSLFQIAFSVYHIVKGNPLISGVGGYVLEFYGDKVISYVLATGSAAGFGATKDLKALADATKVDFGDYFDKAYASASLLLLAFLCAAALSVISSYALPKRGQCEATSVSESARRQTIMSTPQSELEGQVVREQENAHQNGQYPSIEVHQQVMMSRLTHDEPTNLHIEPAMHPVQPES